MKQPTETAPTTATLTLIRIRLNRRTTAVRRDLAHPSSLHKTVMLLALDNLGDQPRQKAGLLFRLEQATRHTPPTLLVQTHTPPDITRLPPAYGTTETRDLTPMLQALTAGRRVRYRITANASVRRKVLDGDPFFDTEPRHKDISLHGDDALAWWQRKAAQAGLSPASTDITPTNPFRRSVTKKTSTETDPHAFRHVLTRFDGLATITDPAQLRHAVLAGIGRGKPYGAGLLSLAPA
ncbi:type I-E CRISPR-associated protein Cas6/Cse3/CasE [Streptomyces triticiradicis]|uniref:Type I-E CRISPR-associated protein Cas6/Cse3/CasE n=1 Tax=Streptomyces triticiradicis TaxID=2651189 RepID=A0A7J5DGP9_9ACTN|nr:type I-E CRISPR-associated protein Cas6/Cse3/CasE [Streptomyces triticiradicis]KAB1987465.1 type I-E CRISPR-associated protein Cas6/Cse3/CasE [Streptomyces triticiradicis]